MRGAMERFLTVNGFSSSAAASRDEEGLNFDAESDSGPEFGVEPTAREIADARGGDQGPCLYLGPQGQRCSRRAVANGFCASHLPARPDQSSVLTSSIKPQSRIVAIVLFVAAILESLWPAFADLFREFIRWIHAH